MTVVAWVVAISVMALNFGMLLILLLAMGHIVKATDAIIGLRKAEFEINTVYQTGVLRLLERNLKRANQEAPINEDNLQ